MQDCTSALASHLFFTVHMGKFKASGVRRCFPFLNYLLVLLLHRYRKPMSICVFWQHRWTWRWLTMLWGL